MRYKTNRYTLTPRPLLQRMAEFERRERAEQVALRVVQIGCAVFLVFLVSLIVGRV